MANPQPVTPEQSPDQVAWRNAAEMWFSQCHKQISHDLRDHLISEVIAIIGRYRKATQEGRATPPRDLVYHQEHRFSSLGVSASVTAAGPSGLGPSSSSGIAVPSAHAVPPLGTIQHASVQPVFSNQQFPSSPSGNNTSNFTNFNPQQLMELKQSIIAGIGGPVMGRSFTSSRTSSPAPAPQYTELMNMSTSSLPSLSGLEIMTTPRNSPQRPSAGSSANPQSDIQ